MALAFQCIQIAFSKVRLIVMLKRLIKQSHNNKAHINVTEKAPTFSLMYVLFTQKLQNLKQI